MKKRIAIYALLALVLSSRICAQDVAVTTPAVEDPAHAELRQLRDNALEALNQGNVDKLLTFLHPNVVVTWQNAEVSRGRDAVRAYLARMLSGPDRKVESFNTSVKVDELTILYGGDAGIAFGNSQDHFKLSSGQDFTLNGRWTATLVKDDGHWLVAGLHSSTNLFDNPLLNAASHMIYWAGGGALLGGLLLGFLLGRNKPA